MSETKRNAKIVGVKKVNRYTKEQCVAEIKRMQTNVSDTHKSGIQENSKYYNDVKAQLLVLTPSVKSVKPVKKSPEVGEQAKS